MSLSEQSRSRIFRFLSGTEIGVEATSEMLSYFPSRDVEEPVTKSVLHQELALVRLELHTELSSLREELRIEMRDTADQLRTEMRDTADQLRTEMRDTADQLRTEMRGCRDDLGSEMGEFRDEVRSEMAHQLRWLVGTQITVLAIMVALVGIVVALIK